MTDHASPWLLAALIAGCAICLAAIVVPLWWHRRRPSDDRTELDNEIPPHRRPVSRDIWDGF